MRATSVGWATRIGGWWASGHDRGHLEVADRDPEPVERPDDAQAGGVRVQPDLLGRLAKGRRDQVVIARLGLAAGEADLARSGGRRWSSAR